MPDQQELITTPTNTDLITLDPYTLAPIPFQLVAPTLKEFLDLATERGLGMEVNSDMAEASAAENLNNLAKGISQVEALVKGARKPLVDAANRISESGRQAVELAQRAKAEQEAKLLAYREKKKAEHEAWMKAEALRQENERKAKEAAAAEARRKAEQEKLEAERKQREAERLQWEAQERERIAAQPLMDGGGKDSAQVTEASQGLAIAAEADATAARADLEAREAAERQRLAEEEARQLEADAMAAPSAPTMAAPSAPTQVKGIKTVMVPTIQSVDLNVLPVAYRLYDEAKIKKHLVDGIQIPGVKFTMAEVVKATKR